MQVSLIFTAPLMSHLLLCPPFAPVQTIPGAFPSFPTDPGQRALYLEAKVVVGEVSVVDDGRVEALAGNNKTDLYKV